jgi:hypothetical protein
VAPVIKERLSKLFEGYDPAVRAVIAEVLSIEQEHISMKRRRVSDQIDEVVTVLANKELKRSSNERVSEE